MHRYCILFCGELVKILNSNFLSFDYCKQIMARTKTHAMTKKGASIAKTPTVRKITKTKKGR